MIVDVHGHVTAPPELYAKKASLLADRGIKGSRHAPISAERVEEYAQRHLKEMDEVGTDIQFISPRPYQLMHSEQPASIVHTWVQTNNDVIAEQARRHPDRLYGVCALPQVAGEPVTTCFEELDRCVRDLGFIGVLLNPDPGEGDGATPGLGEEYWYPLYEKLVEYDLPALVHSAGCRNTRESYAGHFITEESIAIMSLMTNSEVFRDFPGLKLIIGHGGGSVPYQVGRWRVWRVRQENEEDFDASLRRLYYDTCLYNKESLELLFKICGPDRCMFGTEKPGAGSARDPQTGLWLDDLKPVIESIDWLTEADRRNIFLDTALAVFPRFRQALAGQAATTTS